MKLYGAGASPFVRKVRVVLAEKGIKHEHDPILPFNVSAEYKKISPLGKIPALEDGGKPLCDSSVICAYLERKHPQPALYPSDPYEFGRALWFEEYADSAMVNVIGAKIFFKKVIGPTFMNQPLDEAALKSAIDDDLPPLFDYLESQLDGKDALAGGHFSIADVGVGSQFVNLRHAGFGVDAKRWPKLARYVAAVHGRPSFKALIDEEAPSFARFAAK